MVGGKKITRRLVDEPSDDENMGEAEMFGEELIDKELMEDDEDGSDCNDNVSDLADDKEKEDGEDGDSSDDDEEYIEDDASQTSEDSLCNEEMVEDLECEKEIVEEWRAGFASSLEREPRMWDIKSDLKKINLALGDTFETAAWFRIVLQNYAAEKGFSYNYTRNQKKQGIGAVCKIKGCPFYIWCGMNKSHGCLQITNFRARHSCKSKKIGLNITDTALAHRYNSHIQKNKNINVTTLHDDIREDLMIDFSIQKVRRILKKGRQLEFQEDGLQYGMLKKYGELVMKSNPDSRFTLVVNDEQPPRFERVYVRYGAQKAGFLKGCRPFIGLDGCHLKSHYGGIVLAAVARDANDGMFPLALAVVEQETKDSWKWFVEELIADLGGVEDKVFVFMSDKQKGLIEVLNDYSEIEHRHCMRHLYENWYRQFKSLELKKLLWRCSRATTVEMFEEVMEEVKVVNEKAYLWLRERPPQNWCKAYFKYDAKCAAQTNNLCESFNAWIGKGRDLPIMSFLEFYRKKLMRWFYVKGNMIHEVESYICPRILDRFEVIMAEGTRCPVERSTIELFEVTEKINTYVVGLHAQTCTCLEWQLSGIPCKHAVAAIILDRGNPTELIHEYYNIETFKKIYAGKIHPIEGLNKCLKVPVGKEVLQPPTVRKQPGRPRKRRIKSFIERQGKLQKNGKSTLSRKGIVITCSKCGNSGHNRRSCTTKDYGVAMKPKPKRKASSTNEKLQPIFNVRGDDDSLAPILEKKKSSQ